MAVIHHPSLGDFDLKLELGSGAFASVYLAIQRDSHYPVAIKVYDIFDKSATDEEDGESEYYGEDSIVQIINSYGLFYSIDSPLICDIYDVFEFQGHTCVLMEFVEGESLLQFANKNGPFSEDIVRGMFVQLVTAVKILHENNIVHRDLKCENIIVLGNSLNLKLIDFGFAAKLDQKNPTLKKSCGSPAYVAPEIVNSEDYGFEVDVWSLGIILFALSFGELPFDGNNIMQIISMVSSMDPKIPDYASPDLADLVRKLLNKDKKQRITIDKVLKHPWITHDSFGRVFSYDDNYMNNFCIKSLESNIFNKIKTQKSMNEVSKEIKSQILTKESIEYRILNRSSMMKILKKLPYDLMKLV